MVSDPIFTIFTRFVSTRQFEKNANQNAELSQGQADYPFEEVEFHLGDFAFELFDVALGSHLCLAAGIFESFGESFSLRSGDHRPSQASL